MPKKAGPKRIDPETFVPMVLTAQGSDFSILVCHRRWLRGPNVVGGPPEATVCAEYFSFPIAIKISPVTEVMTGYVNRDLAWVPERPEAHGISEKFAKIALAGAWRAVEATLDLGTMSVHVGSKVAKWLSNKRGVKLRNLMCALHWDRWNRDGLDLDARVERLSELGLDCSVRQLERFMVDHGVTLGKNA